MGGAYHDLLADLRVVEDDCDLFALDADDAKHLLELLAPVALVELQRLVAECDVRGEARE